MWVRSENELMSDGCGGMGWRSIDGRVVGFLHSLTRRL